MAMATIAARAEGHRFSEDIRLFPVDFSVGASPGNLVGKDNTHHAHTYENRQGCPQHNLVVEEFSVNASSVERGALLKSMNRRPPNLEALPHRLIPGLSPDIPFHVTEGLDAPRGTRVCTGLPHRKGQYEVVAIFYTPDDRLILAIKHVHPLRQCNPRTSAKKCTSRPTPYRWREPASDQDFVLPDLHHSTTEHPPPVWYLPALPFGSGMQFYEYKHRSLN
ncbi:hypothetical protein IW261DRAFT_1423140 [Armillaria novae-zelandiae]|uniref:Uncharacterized protein n=1 Tax=Armillaria novae-zelandiae TaxID=153914 RepID=A0AA39TZH5_9AGAR|nr:hypothetical protein IW261DRAFT_1423140 [Armillaria novae-zelandiae]